MTASALVRPAGAGDVDLLLALRRRWAGEHDEPSADAGFDDRFRTWWSAERAHRSYWLAELEAEAVGMVNLLTYNRMPSPGRPDTAWGYLANMYVVPERRHEGIGRALLDALIEDADSRGLERIVLSPSLRSVPLYRRAGFDGADSLLLRARREPARPAASS